MIEDERIGDLACWGDDDDDIRATTYLAHTPQEMIYLAREVAQWRELGREIQDENSPGCMNCGGLGDEIMNKLHELLNFRKKKKS